MTEEERKEAEQAAATAALGAIVRTIVGEVFFHDDRAVFRRRLSLLEEATVDALSAQDLWPNQTDAAAYANEAARGWVSRIFAGIRHPSDAPGNNDT